MTRSARAWLPVLVGAAVLLGLPAAPALAAGLPYSLAVGGAGQLVATPAAGGSTLAVGVEQTVAGVEFTPAATTFPDGPGECVSTLEKTTCDPLLVTSELRMQGSILHAAVTGVATPLLTLAGGDESDSVVVDGAGAVGTLALDPGAGADSVTVRGGVAAITLAAGDTGADRYLVQSSSATITGTLELGDGNDVASSLAPNLHLDGGAGDDLLSGAGRLLGGAGNDVLKPRSKDPAAPASNGEVTAGGDGVDRLSFELLAAPLALQKVSSTDVQVAGDPVLKTGFEQVEGGPLGDTLAGVAGPDVLYGGDGNDEITGNGGGDLLDGGPGVNTVSYASAGAPVEIDLAAETGRTGGATDTLRSFRAVRTGAGNDVVVGTAAGESVALGAGDDVASTGAGDDAIDGGPGNDALRGGHGNDSLEGGPGADSALYDDRGPSEPVTVTLASPGGDGAAGESDVLAGIEIVLGGASNDTLTGDEGANTLSGGAGLDTIDGLGGNDVLYGGEARDALTGGPGHDQLYGEGDDDSINAFDGAADAVDCGASADDDAQVDGTDSVAGCEYARRGDVPVPVDADGDGFVAGFDCDDANRLINPGATDIVADRVDQNCDGFDEPRPFVDYGLSLSFSKATKTGRRVMRLVLRELPSNHRVQVTCKAPKRYRRRCAFTRRTKRPSKAGSVSLAALFRKRRLPPGTTIELRITAPGFDGRVRRFTVRRVGSVRDQRLCLPQGARRPRACPAGED
ncbi:MAG: calcium-binding protein [Thermoleophilia bacterium]